MTEQETEQAAEEAATSGATPPEQEESQQEGKQGQQEGSQNKGGMMRAHSDVAQEGQQGSGEGGEEDPFKASASDDGRPTIDLGDGKTQPIPDQFWDAENQQVKHEALFKSWRDTRSSYDQLRSERDQLKQQIDQGQQQGTVPEKAEEYKFEPPENLQRQVSEDDPLLQSFKEIAHQNGIPQEQFSKLAGQFMEKMEEQLGPPLDPETERGKLGPNADTILQTNARWADSLVQNGTLSREEHDELLSLAETATGVRALNKLREQMGEQPIPMEGAKLSELPSKEEWYRQMNEALSKGDQGKVKELEQQASKIFGDQPAGTSEAGLGVPG